MKYINWYKYIKNHRIKLLLVLFILMLINLNTSNVFASQSAPIGPKEYVITIKNAKKEGIESINIVNTIQGVEELNIEATISYINNSIVISYPGYQNSPSKFLSNGSSIKIVRKDGKIFYSQYIFKNYVLL